MQRSQVFKVKGMQRDASMPNANGEFAYEIVNMRVMPAEEGAGFSLTNEKGTIQVISDIPGVIIGQCPTKDSLIVFTVNANSNISPDYIIKIYQEDDEWKTQTLYNGNLGFSADYPIEALFNYETEDIQKVYWIDGINQLRSINITDTETQWTNTSFDSVKPIEYIPNVDISISTGGSFTAGVLQYYITCFNKFGSESPILYTSPLLYIAHNTRGGNVNDKITTAYNLSISNLNVTNWDYVRIYATHRTSIDAVPEGSIVAELKIPNTGSIEYTDYGSNRTSIDPNELHFIGSKYIVAGTMTAKDQVLFLGHLNISSPQTVNYEIISDLFDQLRQSGDIDDFFSANTTKTRENRLEEYKDTYYYYNSNLNNTKSITHYKYGEKYRFGISLMDKYGNWSNPFWLKDSFITVAPTQVDQDTLALPCPQLNVSKIVSGLGVSLWQFLQDNGAISIKPLVVFPSIDERKVLAQGVVCPTVYNLKDRKENGPYAQSSWFMRPNAPIDLWNSSDSTLVHESDNTVGYNLLRDNNTGLYSINYPQEPGTSWLDTKLSLVYDDLSIALLTYDRYSPLSANGYGSIAGLRDSNSNDIIYTFLPENEYKATLNDGRDPYIWPTNTFDEIAKDISTSGAWLEFRHNYALRSKGWTWGPLNDWYTMTYGEDVNAEWDHPYYDLKPKGNKEFTSDEDATYLYSDVEIFPDDAYPRAANGITALFPRGGLNNERVVYYKFRMGASRCAELDVSRYSATIPINRFCGEDLTKQTWRNTELIKFNTGNSAFYVDNSIVTFHSPEVEMDENTANLSTEGYNFRVVGVIPLTATISDSYLEYNGTIYNPSIHDNSSNFGFKKNLVRNRNIGHHGYKGIVAHSALFSGHNAPQTIEYAYRDTGNLVGDPVTNPLHPNHYSASFPLHPWQMTGNIPGFEDTWEDKTKYSTLKRKILSNLRYSASTKFYTSPLMEDVGDIQENDVVLTEGIYSKKLGWKPYNGSSIHWFNSEEQSIIKLPLSGYNEDLVYSANIDSIALATTGESNNDPIPIYAYFYGRKFNPTEQIEMSGYTPYIGGASFDDVEKVGIGASIKYKSSPHAVIGFNPIRVNIEGTNMWTQEILPAFYGINQPSKNYFSLPSIESLTKEEAGVLYENSAFVSIPHQSIFSLESFGDFGLPGFSGVDTVNAEPNYGWLWLGEIYKEADPTFGGDSEYALQNNSWEVGGNTELNTVVNLDNSKHIYLEGIYGSYELGGEGTSSDNDFFATFDYGQLILQAYKVYTLKIAAAETLEIAKYVLGKDDSNTKTFTLDNITSTDWAGNVDNIQYVETTITKKPTSFDVIAVLDRTGDASGIEYLELYDIPNTIFPLGEDALFLDWTIGDTYYQRFDTLKTYSYSDKDENSIVDITSFMVETRINIDGRYDRNRGQESNLQMSPTNFNLLNKNYSQRDNFFTYRMLDEDVQNRKYFPNQVTWSLAKTAGATVDAWMSQSLASVLDLDGTKGKLAALKTFGDRIIAFQDSGISTILFNSRVQIPTSEYVPIQIANSGKVDGTQYFTTDLGCQDKWNIVTTPQGLYFVDYYNKSIYKFNGQIEDIATPNGFRGWCEKNINANSHILGYYDTQSKEVMFYNNDFESINDCNTKWLGFSELTNVFSSFYTYPKAILTRLKDTGIWLKGNSMYLHQSGDYNNLLGEISPYGLTTIVRQDSNIVKIFNTVEFRSDTYSNSEMKHFETFDTIQIEDEYVGKTTNSLSYNKYKPSNLKKLLRTWRANIPRVNNKYNRYVNQWAKVGLWKNNPDIEKTTLHDMAVWYTE